ncbi:MULTISPECIES: hypothetical protein [Paenibacillus]|uniref:hypothetical protein n=1 Tax=Paenibacillus TaxID=44249 RepID=UPI002FE179D6
MSFMDEKIARMMNEAEQSLHPRSIVSGPVRIGQRYFEFTRQSFFDNKLFIYLPQEFGEMPLKYSSIKYPYEQRPEIIRSDEMGSVDFTFKRIDHELEDELVEELTNGMKAMIQRVNPTHIFYESGIEAIGGKTVGFFEFKSTVIEGYLFNIMYFLEFEGQVLMGTFCCDYKVYPDWRDVAYQAIRTITVAKEEEDET